MADPLITLITDFGSGSSYVAQMKGNILHHCPQARIVDICHDIPPQDVRAAAILVQDTLHWFPAGSVHVVVVDPGVGTQRAVLVLKQFGSWILAPDNGCWRLAASNCKLSSMGLRRLGPRFFHAEVAPTFHGRDVFAPAAAALANGVDPEIFTEPTESYVELALPRPRALPDKIEGEVLWVDRFGNLITNIVCTHRQVASIRAGTTEIGRWVATYGHAAPGQLIGLTNSSGRVEIAVVNGSAAARLGGGIGTPVTVTLVSARPLGTTH